MRNRFGRADQLKSDNWLSTKNFIVNYVKSNCEKFNFVTYYDKQWIDSIIGQKNVHKSAVVACSFYVAV